MLPLLSVSDDNTTEATDGPSWGLFLLLLDHCAPGIVLLSTYFLGVLITAFKAITFVPATFLYGVVYIGGVASCLGLEAGRSLIGPT